MDVKLITSLNDLEQITSKYKLSKRVKLNLPFLSDVQNKGFSNKLEKELNACGCVTGKFFLIYSLLLCLIGTLMKYSLFNHSISKTIVTILVITFVSAITGKMVGILISKIQIKIIIHKIKEISSSIAIQIDQ